MFFHLLEMLWRGTAKRNWHPASITDMVKHHLEISADSTAIVHYAPNTEVLSVHKFQPQQPTSLNHVVPYETFSLRTPPVSSLSIHPTLPIILGIPIKKSAIPRGPASAVATTETTPINPGKSKIPLTLYTYYTRHVTSTPLIIEVNAPDSGAISAYCMKHSRCGKYLALHTRSYFSSSSDTTYQIYIFEAEKNYSFITYLKSSSGLEDLEWNLKSDVLLGASTDGHLYVFKFDNNELSLIKSLNLSSSSLSSIVYSEPTDKDDKLSNLGILVGTRDGNSLYIDPTTMSCTQSLLNDIDYPILRVSLGFKGIGIINYISYTNEPSHVIRIPTDNNDESELKVAAKLKAEICVLDDAIPLFNQHNFQVGCGALITKYGIISYVKNDGKLAFKNVVELIQRSEDKKPVSRTPSRPSSSSAPSSNKNNNNNSKNNNKKNNNSNDNSRKRSVDLFDRITDKDDVKRQNDSRANKNNPNNSGYYDRNDVDIRRERYKRMSRNNK